MGYKITVPGVGELELSPAAPMPDHMAALLLRDDRQKFWLARATWPGDWGGKVFLGNAVDRVGKAAFGDEWTGFEPSVNLTLAPLHPVKALASQQDKSAAHSIIQSIVVRSQDENKTLPIPPLTEADWTLARSVRLASLEAIAGPRRRLAEVKKLLVTALRDETLRSYLRPLAGGDFSANYRPASDWNTETRSIENRFYGCRMHPREPFGLGVFGQAFQWIFVDDAGLQRLETRLLGERAPATSLRNRAAFSTELLASMKANEQNPLGTKGSWEKLAREKHSLPRDVFEGIWSDACKQVPGSQWNLPGRRKSAAKSSG